jgi:hypothetical protein
MLVLVLVLVEGFVVTGLTVVVVERFVPKVRIDQEEGLLVVVFLLVFLVLRSVSVEELKDNAGPAFLEDSWVLIDQA